MLNSWSIYRGYGIVDSNGDAVASFLKTFVRGEGIGDDAGMFSASADVSNGGGTGLAESNEEDDSTKDKEAVSKPTAYVVTSNPVYGREFVLDTVIPGRCTLDLQVWGRRSGLRGLLAPFLLGTTQINLEHRWNSPVWRRCLAAGAVPVEIRDLHVGDTQTQENTVARGKIKMWLGIGLPGALPKPPLDEERNYGGSLPPWELRVIVWTLQQNDRGSRVPIYATTELLGPGESQSLARGVGVIGAPSWLETMFGIKNSEPSEEDPDKLLSNAYRTPTHPGRRGTGENGTNLEINWRVKFRLRVDDPVAATSARLRLRHWHPTPWYSPDHLLSESVLDLAPLLQHASASGNVRQDVGGASGEYEASWGQWHEGTDVDASQPCARGCVPNSTRRPGEVYAKSGSIHPRTQHSTPIYIHGKGGHVVDKRRICSDCGWCHHYTGNIGQKWHNLISSLSLKVVDYMLMTNSISPGCTAPKLVTWCS